MSKKHRFLPVMALVLLMFTVTSCAQNSESTAPADSVGIQQGADEQNVQSDAQNSPVPITHITYNDTLGKWAAGDNGVYVLQDVFPAGVNILYIDLATKQEIFLCSAPNCKHNTPDCTSYLPLEEKEYAYCIAYFRDAIYLIQCATAAKQSPHISRMEIDGSGLQDVCFLNKGENFTGKLFGYGDNEILIETTYVSENKQSGKRLERINCSTGERNVVVEYPNDSYYGLMAAVDNKLAFIKINETGNQYFWVNPSSSNISLEECAETAPIGTLFDDKTTTYTIQGDYLCKVSTESKELSAENLITGQMYEFQYPDDSMNFDWLVLTQVFDDNFALTTSNPEGNMIQILLDSETGELTDKIYTITKTNAHQIVASFGDWIVHYIRSDERLLENQAEYGLSGETCYLDVFGIATKEEFLQDSGGMEVSVPAV